MPTCKNTLKFYPINQLKREGIKHKELLAAISEYINNDPWAIFRWLWKEILNSEVKIWIVLCFIIFLAVLIYMLMWFKKKRKVYTVICELRNMSE
jgi:ABC-type multidrug transport system permease subunit